jgi:hypothetical protein
MVKGWQWQKLFGTSSDQIAMWAQMFPDAFNTGVLTKFTPALDIDILHPDAAEAIEELVTERFEEQGYILTRIGKAPKRAVVFRTAAEDVFRKKSIALLAPDGSEGQQLEFLADGEQLAVAGIHPETRRPYSWHGGEPWNIPAAELPYVSADSAQTLIDDAAKLLVEQFGYHIRRATTRQEQGRPATHWRNLVHEGVGEGGRNNALASLAGMLLRRNVDALATLELMFCWNAVRCRPPLDEAEVAGVVNSIALRELNRRRPV